MVLALDKRGFQVHIHAIGDRAVRAALDAFEQAKAVGGSDYEKHRHQMAHLEIIQKADIPRFKSLSVIANFQSYWAFYDPYMTELTVPSLGPERMKLIYPIHSVLSTGARLAAGSDWTVSTLSPLKAMQIAVTRKAPGNPYARVLLKDECVKLKDILAAYTTGGAYANHSEDSTGSLAVGKAADFIVLDRDIFAIKPEQLGQVRVLKTFVDGKLVYDRTRPGDRAVSE
jgi:predicted amidohydrolase YtcJ